MKKTCPRKAIAAGFLICMGCVVFLKVGGGVAGSVLFSAGLWFVVSMDAELFTGRVAQDVYDPLQKLLMLLCNLAGAAVCGLLAGLCLPDAHEAAATLAAGWGTQTVWAVLWKSVMCGVCMYLATSKPAEGSRLPHVVYGVTLFILSGYAHSIALAGYAAIAFGIAWWVIPVAAAGNALGSYAMKYLLTGVLAKKAEEKGK